MGILVIHRTRQPVAQRRNPQRSRRGSKDRWRDPAGGGRQLCQPRRRRRSLGVARCCSRRCALRAQLAENSRRADRRQCPGLQSHPACWPRPAGRTSLPQVAALLDVAPDLRHRRGQSADTFVRPIYAGNALAPVKATTRSRSSPYAPPAARSPPRWQRLEPLPPVLTSASAKLVGRELTKERTTELGAARIIVSVAVALAAENYHSLLDRFRRQARRGA